MPLAEFDATEYVHCAAEYLSTLVCLSVEFNYSTNIDCHTGATAVCFSPLSDSHAQLIHVLDLCSLHVTSTYNAKKSCHLECV